MITKILFFVIVLILLLFLYYFFLSRGRKTEQVTWGVNFSQAQAEFLKIDWKEAYLAMLDDLGAKEVKIITNWDWVEGKKNTFFFDDTDWQVQEAAKRKANVIYVVGMKTGRWPECHLPDWANYLSKQEQQAEILNYIQATVEHHKGEKAIVAWQAENEPLFNFGVCPWYDKGFLKKEVALIKSLDSTRPVIVSDTGEQSWWWGAASIGDVVGTTMYRKVWAHITDKIGFYMDLPLSPNSYALKAKIVKRFFGKKVINVELQAEPWFPNVFEGLPLDQQAKTMNVDQFRQNIAYAKESGLDTFYLWGTEWWYWMKEKQDHPEMWNEAKKLFQSR